MSEILARTGRLLGARWPELLLFSLIGTFAVHIGVIGAATLAATQNAYAGVFALPLPILVRLACFAAMFLALRPLLPNYQARVDEGDVQLDRATLDMTRPQRRSSEVTTFASQVIVPFFVMYSAWDFLQRDIDQYTVAIERRMFAPPEEVEAATTFDFDWRLVLALVSAFVLRILVHRFRRVLPTWVAAVEVYLEGLWVFLLALLAINPLQALPEWIAGRELSVWIADTWRSLLTALAPLEAVWGVVAAVAPSIGEAVHTLALPMAWLAITGIILARRLGRRTSIDLISARSRELQRVRERSVPGWLREVLDEVTEDYRLRIDALIDVGYVVLRGGMVTLGGFLVAYAVVDVLSGWALRGAFWLIGPGELAWYASIYPLVSTLVNSLTDLPQFALLAATFDYCLGQVNRDRRPRPPAVGPGPGGGPGPAPAPALSPAAPPRSAGARPAG